MRPSPTPLLVLALSLRPDAVPANICDRIIKAIDKTFDAVGRVAWKVGHHAGAPRDIFVKDYRFENKRTIIWSLKSLGGSWGIRVFRGQGVADQDYDKGLDNLAYALNDAATILEDTNTGTLSPLARIRDIKITGERDIFIHESFTGSIQASIPHDAPRETLKKRLSAKLLEFDLKKQFQGIHYFSKGDEVSHGSYVVALTKLQARFVPKEVRRVSRITVTDGSKVRTTHVQWSKEDRFLEGIHLDIPPGLMGIDPIVNAVLETQIGEILGEFGHSAMAWQSPVRQPFLGAVVGNGGVDDVDYENALRGFVTDLRRRYPTNHLPKDDLETRKRRLLARIVVTPKDMESATKPMEDAPDFFELHVPIDQLSVKNVLEASRLIPVTPDSQARP